MSMNVADMLKTIPYTEFLPDGENDVEVWLRNLDPETPISKLPYLPGFKRAWLWELITAYDLYPRFVCWGVDQRLPFLREELSLCERDNTVLFNIRPEAVPVLEDRLAQARRSHGTNRVRLVRTYEESLGLLYAWFHCADTRSFQGFWGTCAHCDVILKSARDPEVFLAKNLPMAVEHRIERSEVQ